MPSSARSSQALEAANATSSLACASCSDLSGHQRLGCLLCQSVICWYARATASTCVSPKDGPTICRPIGSELREKPQGIEMAGVPNRLKAEVLLEGRL